VKSTQDATATTDPFAQPTDVSAVELAFPANPLMPAWDDIPEDFRRDRGDARPWLEFQRKWFFEGFPKAGLLRREGVDAEIAFRHLASIQGSFAPKHEHKEAAVAWLASRWFAGIA
jgi:hypothetical protein